ncbi:IclR family transcriptional regulator [Kitasatospora sp. MMS16-BH015]|nr:IclR family transcriptional regulator [Kitasatospora sp. MMS16-BH015]
MARAMQLLAELGQGERTLEQLATALGVHKSTVLRLLQPMAQERIVQHDETHRYRLGPQLFALAGQALEQRGIRTVAAPHLAELNAATGQTVHLAAYEGGEVIYIDKYESRQPVRMYSRVGLRAALHSAAVAKVLLAALPPTARREVAASIEYTPFTANTLTTPEALLAELETVAAQGWAQDHAEHEPFVNCLAVPVHDATRRVVAAVSVSVPDVLLDHRQVLALLPRLQTTAAAVSADCGFHPVKEQR